MEASDATGRSGLVIPASSAKATWTTVAYRVAPGLGRKDVMGQVAFGVCELGSGDELSGSLPKKILTTPRRGVSGPDMPEELFGGRIRFPIGPGQRYLVRRLYEHADDTCDGDIVRMVQVRAEPRKGSGMDLKRIQVSLETLSRHLDEIQHSAAFQIAGDEQFVRSLLMAPAQIAEHRRERDGSRRRIELLTEQIKLQEDGVAAEAYAEGLVDGKNAAIRDRQERQILSEDAELATFRNNLRGAERDLREAEVLYEQGRNELHVSLAVLRDASAKLEWLGFLT